MKYIIIISLILLVSIPAMLGDTKSSAQGLVAIGIIALVTGYSRKPTKSW